jgi:HEAT repeat protein/cyclophilin family peptidyl-prolyl cis-trans isomerase
MRSNTFTLSFTLTFTSVNDRVRERKRERERVQGAHMLNRYLLLFGLLLAASPAMAQQQTRRPLASSDIDDIARLVMLEDRRDFDEASLARLLTSSHPEVRRRAVQSIARLADPRGRAMVTALLQDRDTAVAATASFAVGQLKDSAAVATLGKMLATAPVTVAAEAARSLGKVPTPEGRAALALYLASTAANASTVPVIGEALLAIGRNTTRGDIAPIVRWTQSTNAEVRWRATWALFRARDPAAVPELLRLSKDPSGHVRSWAVRALAAPQADSAKVRAAALAQLIASVRDSDRRVRTEAIRTLATYDDSASFDVLTRALDDADSWLSVSAAEALARRTQRSADAVAALTRATAVNRASALRIVSVQSLLALSPQSAREPAVLLASDTLPLSGQIARQVAARLNPDSQATGGRGRGGGGGGGANRQRPIDTGKTEADYRRIVERWVVPAYNGAPRPIASWQLGRGVIELELYPGDAPLAVEDFVKVMEAGTMIGTEFGRVVPDFVAQQRAIYTDHTLRDEVTRLGLTRGNLSWASAGLDTGRPGYTLGSTPQPHNEGNFTTLGRVLRGLDVVDRIELGDRIVAARMLR